MKFILLYDCPLKTCDKIWLYNGLKKYGNVKIVSTLANKSYFRIQKTLPKLKIGKIIVLMLTTIQCVRSIIVSKKNDVIVTWGNKQGCIVSNICSKLKIKRKVVSFMWIAIPKSNYKMVKKVLENNNFLPIINNASLKNDFIKYYKLKKWNGLFLPDVFDDSQRFESVRYKTNNKYIFAGGVNNRDWDSLIKTAKETPSIKYIIVSNKNEIQKQIIHNVTIKENLSSTDYYKLMEKSFITICPLKDNKVSGLINIIKSSQFGIPCISTKLDVTEMYYSDDNKKELLFKRNNYKELKQKISNLYNSDKKDYIKITEEFQSYIKNNFNPEHSIKKLIIELKKRNWIQ